MTESPTRKQYLQSLTKADLAQVLLPFSRGKRGLDPEQESRVKLKQAQLRAKQVFSWAYARGATTYEEMTDVAKEVRDFLAQEYPIFRLQEESGSASDDGTRKFLWSLGDNKTVESVVIPAALTRATEEDLDQGLAFSGKSRPDESLDGPLWTRLTACISSQVGCAMACRFCLTGIQGLDRNLAVHEIVAQIYELRRLAFITNIVFMGMGEPLHNVDNVLKAIDIFLDADGFGFSKRKITVSTSGLVPQLQRLNAEKDVSLAISFNATTNEIRDVIMPVNRKYPLEVLMKACRGLQLGPRRKITFEYVLLQGVNDTLEDARRLEEWTRGLPRMINLIPFNEHSGSDYRRPDDRTVRAFQRTLMDRGVTATVRVSRGRDISAACGQLRSLFDTARGTHKHRDYPTASPSAVSQDPVALVLV